MSAPPGFPIPCAIVALATFVGPPCLSAQTSAVPIDSVRAWFAQTLDHLTSGGGRWLTDNSAYQGPDEPWATYGMEWEKGPSGRAAQGRLVGIDDKGVEQTFWEFMIYWDALRDRAVVMQINSSGAFGIGDMRWISASEQELDQTFRWPDGSTTRSRHLERHVQDARYSQSFEWRDGAWQPRRSYVWRRRGEPKAARGFQVGVPGSQLPRPSRTSSTNR